MNETLISLFILIHPDLVSTLTFFFDRFFRSKASIMLKSASDSVLMD